MKNDIYALYKGDTYIDQGTTKELAEKYGMTENAILFHSYPSARKRNPEGYQVINLDKTKREPICIICHKKTDAHPKRLYHYEYGLKRRNEYSYTEYWNFCDECFDKRFMKWIRRNNKGYEEYFEEDL